MATVEAHRRDELIAGFFERAKSFVQSWTNAPSWIDRDELEGAAMEGLVEAAQTWDPDKSSFSTWAYRQMRYAILDYMRALDHLPRSARRELNGEEAPDHLRAPISLNTLLFEHDQAGSTGGRAELQDNIIDHETDGKLRVAEDRATILRLLRHLSDRERTVVALYYFGGYTEAEIASIYGVTNCRVNQISREATTKMRRNSTFDPTPLTRVKTIGKLVDDGQTVVKSVEPRGDDEFALTPREREILASIAAGNSNAEIAEEFFVSQETVKTHVRHILAKLKAKTRSHAIARAFESGVLYYEKAA